MTKLHLPPGRTSICPMLVRKPLGPHQLTRCLGSVQASKTRARGASRSRVVEISRSLVAVTVLLLVLKFLEVEVEAVEPLFPDLAVMEDPIVDLLERLCLQLAGPELRVAAADDEAGPLQHLEVLGDG